MVDTLVDAVALGPSVILDQDFGPLPLDSFFAFHVASGMRGLCGYGSRTPSAAETMYVVSDFAHIYSGSIFSAMRYLRIMVLATSCDCFVILLLLYQFSKNPTVSIR